MEGYRRPGASLVSPRSSSIGKRLLRPLRYPTAACELAAHALCVRGVRRGRDECRLSGRLFPAHWAPSSFFATRRRRAGREAPSVTRPSPETDSAAVARQMGRPLRCSTPARLCCCLSGAGERAVRSWLSPRAPVRLCRGGTLARRPPACFLYCARRPRQ